MPRFKTGSADAYAHADRFDELHRGGRRDRLALRPRRAKVDALRAEDLLRGCIRQIRLHNASAGYCVGCVARLPPRSFWRFPLNPPAFRSVGRPLPSGVIAAAASGAVEFGMGSSPPGSSVDTCFSRPSADMDPLLVASPVSVSALKTFRSKGLALRKRTFNQPSAVHHGAKKQSRKRFARDVRFSGDGRKWPIFSSS